MGKIKSLFKRLAGYISPVYVTMLVAAFILWYITKLGETYTTDEQVTVVIDGQEYEVDCTIRGKGTNLINYTMKSKKSSFTILSTELSFDKEEVNEDGDLMRHISAVSLQQALSARMIDVDIITLGAVPTIIVEAEDK
jgi:hypothetical protein